MKKVVIIAVALFISTFCSTFSYASNEIKLRATGYYIDINSQSDISAQELDAFLSKSGLAGLGKCFKEVESLYNINAEALSAIAIEESGWGKKCANTNNLVGFEARHKSKNRYAAFKSKEECLHIVAKHLANNYVKPGQKYFYKSAMLKDINHFYCELPTWKNNVGNIVKKIQKYKNNIRKHIDL